MAETIQIQRLQIINPLKNVEEVISKKKCPREKDSSCAKYSKSDSKFYFTKYYENLEGIYL